MKLGCLVLEHAFLPECQTKLPQKLWFSNSLWGLVGKHGSAKHCNATL